MGLYLGTALFLCKNVAKYNIMCYFLIDKNLLNTKGNVTKQSKKEKRNVPNQKILDGT